MKKKYWIILIIIAVLFIGLGVYLIINDNKADDTDASKFAKEYTNVSEDNVFVYRNIDEIIKIMENGTGVVYLGFPECKWCQAYVKYLSEVASEVGIEKIYYFNISEDRKNNTSEYKKIVSLLKDHLQYDEEGNERIYVPNVSFHINGELIGVDYETSLDTHNLSDPSEYWTDKEVEELKANLTNYMEQVYGALNSCTSCNE